ncbi:MAG: ABC transporter ATP-binding protein [Dehalococcoidia bacterium]|jgi:branched-chain amino acid transport system ATP-binding protein|nr:ABC transporter ATP-binding protein [Dehalococcoidia bacterium]
MLEVDRIDVYYGDLQALWDVSLTIRGGEIAALVGSNGAGKSTLLKTICGLLRPTRGSIRFDSLRFDKTPAHQIVERGVCIVHEGRRLFPEMSVLENLEMGAFNAKAKKKKNETIAWVYEIFPRLKERKNQTAGTLSGGEQQMIAIGRALMSQPKLLLMDEVSLGLAPLLVQNIYDVVREINTSKQITIFLVEQNVRLALEVAERGYIIETGRIVKHDRADLLLSSEDVRESYLGFESGQEDI